jgi:hypothetical protein
MTNPVDAEDGTQSQKKATPSSNVTDQADAPDGTQSKTTPSSNVTDQADPQDGTQSKATPSSNVTDQATDADDDQPNPKRRKVEDNRYTDTEETGSTPAIPIPFQPLTSNIRTRLCKGLGLAQSKTKMCFTNVGSFCSGKPSTAVMKGFGNCFFHTIAYALSGDQGMHLIVRDQICNVIAANADQLQPFLMHKKKIFTNGNEYLEASCMRVIGTWGTDAEIMATAYMIKRDLVVYHGGAWLRYGFGKKCTTNALYIENTGQHYNFVTGV